MGICANCGQQFNYGDLIVGLWGVRASLADPLGQHYSHYWCLLRIQTVAVAA